MSSLYPRPDFLIHQDQEKEKEKVSEQKKPLNLSKENEIEVVKKEMSAGKQSRQTLNVKNMQRQIPHTVGRQATKSRRKDVPTPGASQRKNILQSQLLMQKMAEPQSQVSSTVRNPASSATRQSTMTKATQAMVTPARNPIRS